MYLVALKKVAAMELAQLRQVMATPITFQAMELHNQGKMHVPVILQYMVVVATMTAAMMA